MLHDEMPRFCHDFIVRNNFLKNNSLLLILGVARFLLRCLQIFLETPMRALFDFLSDLFQSIAQPADVLHEPSCWVLTRCRT